MIPPTKHGLPAMAVLSCMQKSIRRNLPRLAMECAVELIHTSLAFNTMVCNRLQVVSQEDLDTAARPDIVPFVKACCDQAREWYKGNEANPGKSRMAIGNAIRMMCAAPKSREGDHFQAAIGLRSLLAGFVPEIPDWANDGHTLAGKRMGRGIDFFREESTKLVQPNGYAATLDTYEDEAYEMWKLRDARKKPDGDLPL